MRSLLSVLLLAACLTACGFQLRGSYELPWETLYLDIPVSDEMYLSLRRRIEQTTGTRIVDDPQQAKATLVVSSSSAHKNILSLTAKGRVREYQLTRVFVYRVQDAAGNEILPANQIILQRDLTFDDQQFYAKEAEESQIQKEMQQDILQQLLRRLSASSRTLGK